MNSRKFISDEEIDKALDYLRDNADEAAKARAERIYVEEYRKTVKAQIMKEHDTKSAVIQEREAYAGALSTVGLNIGISAGGVLGWAVFAPTTGLPLGALAGEYVGVSGDVGIGLGAGVNVLLGGSNRTIALQPISLQGSIALNVVAGVSSLKLRPLPL